MEFVKINEDFEIGKYLVTNREYKAFCDETGREYPRLLKQKAKLPVDSIEYQTFCLHPVTYVTYHDAFAFCEYYGYSLPTEEQWYLAAAGIEKRKYAWGNTWAEGYCNTWESGINTTTPVGSFPRGHTPEGVCDLTGNVWEWTRSEDESEKGKFVLRGGSWNYNAVNAACAYRFHYNPIIHYNIGFRCSRTPLASDPIKFSTRELIKNLRSGTQNTDAILEILEKRLIHD